jgi:hypothetical protein
MKLLLILAALIALTIAQSKPNWPNAASTSLFIHGWERRGDRHFLRWFYDRTTGKERIDGPREFLGEPYWTTTILNTMTHREYHIIHQGSLVLCFERATNMSIPHPNFDRVRYIGKAEFEYNVVDHWIERTAEGRDHLQIYDRVDNFYVVRNDWDDGRRGYATTFEFHEWNVGAQDPALFAIPQAILNICTTVP